MRTTHKLKDIMSKNKPLELLHIDLFDPTKTSGLLL